MNRINQENQFEKFSITAGSISQNLSAQWANRHDNKNIRTVRSSQSLAPQKSEQLKPNSSFSRERARAEIQQAIVRVRERKELLKLRVSGKPDEP